MTISSASSGMFWDQVMEICWGAQTEITIFIVAFLTHSLLFGKHRVPARKTLPSCANKWEKNHMPQQQKATGRKPPQAVASPRTVHADTLARVADDICKECTEVESCVKRIEHYLQAALHDEIADALAALVEGAGKSLTPELLAAVRNILQKSNVVPNVKLGEQLLKGYLFRGLADEFDRVLQEVESLHGKVSSIGLLALKAAIRRQNFWLALDRFETMHSLWCENETPSCAPQALLKQVVRMAMQNGELSALLQRFAKLNCSGDFLGVVLTECAQQGDATNLKVVEEFGRSQGLVFSNTAYCALVRGARDSSEAARFLREGAKRGSLSKELFSAACERACADEDAILAELLLKQLPANPPSEGTGKMLRLLAQARKIPNESIDTAVLKLYKAHCAGHDLSNDLEAGTLIAKAALRCKQMPTLQQFLGSFTDHANRVNLLKTFARDHSISETRTVFEACREKSASLYNAMVELCSTCRSLHAAEDIVTEATNAGLADVVTYNTLVKAHLQEGSLRGARKVIDAMRKVGFQPNGVTFNELVDAALKVNIDCAWGIVNEMYVSGIKPNRITCSILLKSLQQHSSAVNVTRILDVLGDMDDDVDEVLLSSVIEAIIRINRADLLANHLQRQRSPQKVQVTSPHAIGSLIRAYGYVGDIEGVWDTWSDMRKRHIKPTSITLGCMVEALTSNGDADAGYEILHEMLNDPHCKSLVNSVIYGSVLKGFSHQKRFDRVWSMYQEMLEHSMQFSIVTYNTLMDACARSGEMARIPGLLNSMTDQGLEPNIITYSIVIKGYCQDNKLEEALQVWESMVQTTSLRPDEIMYNTILDGCARQGLYDKGMVLLDEMQKTGVRPSNFTLSVLVKLASRARLLDRAFEVCQELSEKYKFHLNVHVYSNLVQACTINNSLPRAFEVLGQMVQNKVRLDVRVYTLLIRACIASREGKDGAGLVRAALGLQGAHPVLAKAGNLARLSKGLSSDLLVEVLEGISNQCNDNHLAITLWQDIKHLPNLKLPPRLQLRLASEAGRK